ncbi:MAG: hypothetical protein HRT76_15075, partial [Halieaceae bacterium]|nr:hypothetical protein [Halieaceae bacterium]
MGVREDVLVSVQGDIKDYLKAITRIPPETEKVFKEGAKKAAAANKKATAAMAKEWDGVKKAAQGAALA